MSPNSAQKYIDDFFNNEVRRSIRISTKKVNRTEQNSGRDKVPPKNKKK
jgi:hypothetical protein